KPTTSPCAPQPKQWKKPFLSLTVKDGDFSLWNGHRPAYSEPERRFSETLRPTTSDRLVRARSSSRKPGGKARAQDDGCGAVPPWAAGHGRRGKLRGTHPCRLCLQARGFIGISVICDPRPPDASDACFQGFFRLSTFLHFPPDFRRETRRVGITAIIAGRFRI